MVNKLTKFKILNFLFFKQTSLSKGDKYSLKISNDHRDLLNHYLFFFGQVVDEIWICENQTVTKWESDIFEYKEALAKKVRKQIAKMRDG